MIMKNLNVGDFEVPRLRPKEPLNDPPATENNEDGSNNRTVWSMEEKKRQIRKSLSLNLEQWLDVDKFQTMCPSDKRRYYHSLKWELEEDLRKREANEDIAEIGSWRLAKKRAMDRQLATLEISEALSVFHRWAEKVTDLGDLESPPNGINLSGTNSGGDNFPEGITEENSIQDATAVAVKPDLTADNVQNSNSQDDSDWGAGMFTLPRNNPRSTSIAADMGTSGPDIDKYAVTNENESLSPPHQNWNFSNWNSAYNSTRMDTANRM
ncbi:hypothetical protein M758_UG233800 [Ceratodon purpureus]|nr:hypothetical protein M758_UG233800 [Ceratodon purpureus]